jgi:hypothetical protein
MTLVFSRINEFQILKLSEAAILMSSPQTRRPAWLRTLQRLLQHIALPKSVTAAVALCLMATPLFAGKEIVAGEYSGPPIFKPEMSWTLFIQGFSISAVVLSLGFGFYYYFIGRHKGRIVNDPKQLFHDLCRVHQLSKFETLALKELTTHQQLEMPALIFVQPALWQLEKVPALQSYQKTLATIKAKIIN